MTPRAFLWQPLLALLALASLSLPVGAARHRSGRSLQLSEDENPVLDTPDLTAYDPTTVLCARGKDADGKPKIQGWCRNWLACIRAGAQPQGDKAAVLAAWKPADCREVCGVWPVLTPPANRTAPRNGTAPAKDAGLANGTRNTSEAQGGIAALLQSGRDCNSSCANFQESLSSCVATILFEPGKVAVMGIPSGNSPTPPAHCTAANATCMPDLPIRYQRCVAKAAKPARDCKVLKLDMEDCKDCPQLEGTYLSKYHSFVGGCMDQLNAYWQATHPGAGGAALPGSAGCSVH
mmetsp:Transcript_75890/g.226242  ORF Transcript_75890/g.226242 Transcript_75890/m.226242 type:complete len:292 (+) Transcript_75890:52-927(+)